MADYDFEIGSDLYFDHLNGHPNIQDQCPYCEEEYEQEQKKLNKKNE